MMDIIKKDLMKSLKVSENLKRKQSTHPM